MSDQTAAETATTQPLPNAPAFKRAPLSQQEIFQIAAKIDAAIDWTFVEAQGDQRARYIGKSPIGVFELLRDDLGGLVGGFQNTAELETPGENGSFNVTMTLPEAANVGEAKAAIPLRLVDNLNQCRRDDDILNFGQDGQAEPDLI